MGIREQKKLVVREQILDTCGRLFRQSGFDETTVTEIIDEVGISRQTFFNYFSSKEEVLTELGLAWLRTQAEIPRIDARAHRGSILQGARNAILAQVRAVVADEAFMRLVFTRSGLLFPQAPADRETERVRRDHTRPIFEGIAMVMRAAQDAGEVRPDVDPMQAAEMYVSLMLMTIRFWLIDYWRDGVGLEERATRALDVLEAGLKAAP